MKNRKQRVEMMVDLIKNKCIGSQEELARLLEEAGFSVTQATLSRDLKMLKTTRFRPTAEATCTCFPTAILLRINSSPKASSP